MPARARRLSLLAVGAMLVGAGCAPAGLDAQQRSTEARECASLLVRHVAHRAPVGLLSFEGAVLDLGHDPAGFFAALAKSRGVDAFPLEGTDKADRATRASFVSDLCRAKDASPTTTTTTTVTTAPAEPDTGG